MAAERQSGAIPNFRLSDYCCRGGRDVDRVIDPRAFDPESLVIARRGKRALLFSPLGSNPVRPKIALVGITPGGQNKVFERLLRSCAVDVAAKRAAFVGVQTQIKDLLNAHGFAKRIGIDLVGDLNENQAVLTTSLVKCCLMVESGYRYKAPNAQDIEAFSEASFCIRNRFVTDISRHASLKWVVIFGAPSWEAINSLMVGAATIRQHLEAREIEVLNFPHFSQNQQQRAIFKLGPNEEAQYFREHPDHGAYAAKARKMRDSLFMAMERRCN